MTDAYLEALRQHLLDRRSPAPAPLLEVPRLPGVDPVRARNLHRSLVSARHRCGYRYPVPLPADLLGDREDLLALGAGVLLLEHGNLSLARDELRRLHDHPIVAMRVAALIGIGLCHLIEGDPAGGIPVLCAGLSQEAGAPWAGYLHATLARLYRDLKDRDLALEEARAAVADDPGSADHHHVLGQVALQFRDIDVAEEHLGRALEAGGGPRTRFLAALVQGRRGRQGEFLRLMNAALVGLSASPSRLDQVDAGLVSLIFGNPEDAFDRLEAHGHMLHAGPLLWAKRNARFATSCDMFADRHPLIRKYANLCDERAHERDRVRRHMRSPLMMATGERHPSTRLAATVGFLDMRGFTRWSCAQEEAGIDPDVTTRFLQGFYRLVGVHLRGLISMVKFEGDGVMFVAEGDVRRNPELLEEQLRAVRAVFEDFADLEQARCEDLVLGGGLVHGEVVKFHTGTESIDYVGYRVNLSARLCDQARPAGLIFCADEVLDGPLAPRLREIFQRVFPGSAEAEVGGMKGIPRNVIQVLRTPPSPPG